MVVRVPELLVHVLNNPKAYPGPHNVSQERTSRGYQKLDTSRQLQLIFKAIVARLNELLIEGHPVSIPEFGTFCFAPVWHQAKYGPDMIHQVPCFVPDSALKKACPSYDGKEALQVDRNALSAAQSVPAIVQFLNEVPIAAGCYYGRELVKSAIKQIFTAVVDLADRGYELELEMGEVKFVVAKGNLKCTFGQTLHETHGMPMRCRGAHWAPKGQKLSSTWKKPEFSDSMAKFLPRPKSRETHNMRIATANVGVMGRDLTSMK